jgi:hypothetical protein
MSDNVPLRYRNDIDLSKIKLALAQHLVHQLVYFVHFIRVLLLFYFAPKHSSFNLALRELGWKYPWPISTIIVPATLHLLLIV